MRQIMSFKKFGSSDTALLSRTTHHVLRLTNWRLSTASSKLFQSVANVVCRADLDQLFQGHFIVSDVNGTVG